MTIEDLLYLNTYHVDREHPHIRVVIEICRTQCKKKMCTYTCPARCYVDQDGEIQFSHENCLECGTCMYACDQGAITWDYPQGGKGVSFRMG